jgi:hypothetical protein
VNSEHTLHHSKREIKREGGGRERETERESVRKKEREMQNIFKKNDGCFGTF